MADKFKYRLTRMADAALVELYTLYGCKVGAQARDCGQWNHYSDHSTVDYPAGGGFSERSNAIDEEMRRRGLAA